MVSTLNMQNAALLCQVSSQLKTDVVQPVGTVFVCIQNGSEVNLSHLICLLVFTMFHVSDSNLHVAFRMQFVPTPFKRQNQGTLYFLPAQLTFV